MLNNKKFSDLRTKHGLSREHLSAKLGVSAAVIQVVETLSKHNPSINLILKYMKYFKVELNDLVDMNVELGDAV